MKVTECINSYAPKVHAIASESHSRIQSSQSASTAGPAWAFSVTKVYTILLTLHLTPQSLAKVRKAQRQWVWERAAGGCSRGREGCYGAGEGGKGFVTGQEGVGSVEECCILCPDLAGLHGADWISTSE